MKQKDSVRHWPWGRGGRAEGDESNLFLVVKKGEAEAQE